ncbi:alpha/beta hydrolase [Streptacidiphilus carbonis]|uniref:alpha/beta hydrolase n=1 Tax=Streptacidiphilus carbonis TaxID=105422 RepID=UPI000A057373|nr:alpha/beta fold hydrolase [Streptacidiphilus carbonis]
MEAVAKGLTRTGTGARPWSAPAEALLLTPDGVRIHAAHRPADADAAAAGTDLAVVLAHGFSGAVERPALQRAAGVLSHHAGVVTFSFRGHGRSGGLSTVGDREVLDLQAAVEWARSLGYRRIVTAGFSMGGAVVVRHAALYGGVAAVAAVSAPARWYYRGTVPMRRLHWVVMRPLGRVVGRLGLRTRIDPKEWKEIPVPPVRAAALLAERGIPLLVVHGDNDPYFPLDHPRSLHLAASGKGSSELWIEPGFGHAENAADEALLERVGDWLTSAR